MGPRWPRSCSRTRRASDQQPGERRLEPAVAFDLADDVANDAAEIGLELAQRPVGALELLGMGVALVLDQGELADPRIGLAQLDADAARPAAPASRAPGSAAWRRSGR